MNWKEKLTSRKFWVAISDFVAMLAIYLGAAESEAEKISVLIMAGAAMVAYIVGEGFIDAMDVRNKIEKPPKE